MASDKVVISIVPTVTAGSLLADDTVLCSGEATFFNHTGFSGNITIQDSTAGGSWNTASLIQPQANRYSTGVLSNSVWYRAIASAGSCADTSEVLFIGVNVPPASPIISASGPTTFCQGDSVNLLVTNYSSSLVWNDPAATSGPVLNVKSGGSYSVTYSDANECVSISSSITITVNQSPNKPQIQILGNPNTCLGDTLVLFANNPNNDSFLWNDILSTTSDSLQVFNPGTYNVTASKNGCSTTSLSVTLLFNFKPADPIITRFGPEKPCEGDEVRLISSYSSGIMWNTGSTNDTIVVTSNGTFFVSYADPGGCMSTSGNSTISFTAAPTAPVITQVGDSLMSSVIAFSYQWIGPFGPISGATSRYYKPTVSGKYTVFAYTEEGCGSPQSSKYTFNGSGISESMLSGILMYPNPVVQFLTIENQVATTIDVSVFNAIGKEIQHVQIDAKVNQIDLSELSPGAYLIVLSSNQGRFYKTIIKN